MINWERQIRESTDESWKATKFIHLLKEHKAKYPEFIAERLAEFFAHSSYKVQGGLAYTDIAALTQQLRKARYRTEEELQSENDYNLREIDRNQTDEYTYDKEKDPYGG